MDRGFYISGQVPAVTDFDSLLQPANPVSQAVTPVSRVVGIPVLTPRVAYQQFFVRVGPSPGEHPPGVVAVGFQPGDQLRRGDQQHQLAHLFMPRAATHVVAPHLAVRVGIVGEPFRTIRSQRIHNVGPARPVRDSGGQVQEPTTVAYSAPVGGAPWRAGS